MKYTLGSISARCAKAIEAWQNDENKRKKLENIFKQLKSDPFYDRSRPKVITHLKGSYLCKREYKIMNENYRLIYDTDDSKKEINIIYFGERPWK